MKRKKFLLISVIISLIIIISSFIFLRTQFVFDKIRVALESQLEKQLKHDVNIAYVSGNVLRGLIVKEFEVNEKENDSSIISADEVVINYKLWGLLKGQFLVTNLHFIKPQINAYLDENGVLNLQTLVSQKDGSDSNGMFNFLVSQFTLESGEFHFTDAKQNLNVTATGFNMSVEGPLDSWNHSGNFAFVDGRLNWNRTESKIDKFSTKFHISEKNSFLKVRLDTGDSWILAVVNAKMDSAHSRTEQGEGANNPFLETKIISELELRDFQRFLFANKEAEGKIYLNVDASGTFSDISGTMALTSSRTRLDKFIFDNLTVRAEFNRNSLEVSNLSGKLADGEIQGSLSVNKTDKAFSYDSDIKLFRLNTAKFVSMLTEADSDEKRQSNQDSLSKIEGFLNGNLNIKNNQTTFSSQGDFELTDCSINGVKISNSKAHYQIKDDRILLSANLDEARVDIESEISISSPLALNFRVDQIDTDKLSEILSVPDFSGTGMMAGTLTFREKESFSEQVDSVHSALLLPLSVQRLLQPTLTSVSIQANFSVPDASFSSSPLGHVKGDFNYVDRKLTLEKITFEQDECVLRGYVLFSDKTSVQLKAEFDSLEVAKYRALFFGKDYPISGLMDGSISVYGNSGKLNGEGNIKFTQLSAWGLDIEPFSLPIKLNSSTVYISYILVKSKQKKLGDGQAYFSAKLKPNGDYEFGLLTEIYPRILFEENALNQRRLPLSLFPSSIAETKLKCRITGIGNLKKNEFDIDLELKDAYHLKKFFGDLNLSGRYRNSVLSIGGSGLDETFKFNGRLVLEESIPYELNLTATEVKLSRLIAMIDSNLQEKIEGEIDGTVQVTGELKEPEKLKVRLRIPRLALRHPSSISYDIVNRDLIELEFSERTLQLKSLELVNRNKPAKSLLGFSGDIAFSKKVSNLSNKRHEIRNTKHLSYLTFSDFTVYSSGFDTELLGKILNKELPVIAIPDFEFNLSGSADSPVFSLNYQIPKLVLYKNNAFALSKPLEIDDFRGRLFYQNNLLNVNCQAKPVEKSSSKDVNQIYMKGKIPIDLSLVSKPLEERFLNQSLELKVMAKLKAEFLEYFNPNITSSGILKLTSQVKNTLRNPEITGKFSFDNIDLTSQVFPQPVKNGKGSAVFSFRLSGFPAFRLSRSTTVSVLLDEAEFHMGRSRYSAVGEYSVEKGEPRFRLNISGKNIELEPLLSHLTGRKFRFDSSCDANLLLSGTGFEPDDMNVLFRASKFKISPVWLDTFVIENSQPILVEMRDGILKFESFNLHRKSTAYDEIISKISTSNQKSAVVTSLPESIRFNSVLYEDLGISTDTISISGQIPPFVFTGITSQQKSPLSSANRTRLQSGVNSSLNISIHRIDVSKWTEMLNLPYPVTGNLSVNLKISGLLDSPTIESSWIIDKPIQTDFPFINRIAGSVIYSDKLLTVNETQFYLSDSSVIKATGDVPIDLAFIKKSIKQRFLDEPMNLRVKGEDVKLNFLSSFSKLVKEAEGTANIDIAVKGNSVNPYYEGKLEIFDFSAKLSDFEKPIRNGRLELKAIKGIVLLEHLSFQMGWTNFLANGNIKMDGIVPKILNIENFKLQNASINDFASVFLDSERTTSIAEGFFGQITAEANMKVKLPLSLHEIKLQDILRNVSSNIKFREVVIGWKNKDSSAVQYKVNNPQVFEVKLKNRRLYFDFKLKELSNHESPLTLAVKGDFRLNEEVLFDMDIVNFDVSPIKNWFNFPYEVTGLIHSQLRIRGDTSSPVIEFNWYTEAECPLCITRTNIDKFSGKLSYSNQNLQILGQTAIGQNYAQFSSSIPFSISLSEFQAKPLESELETEIDVKINNLEFVPLIDSQLAHMEGNGEINITMGGIVSNPSISGIARFNDISFYLPVSDIEVKDTELFARIDRSGIRIDRFSGKLNGGNGEIKEIPGEIGIEFPTRLSQFFSPKKLNLRLIWSDSVFRSSNLYWNWNLLKCDADLQILGNTDMPVLEGNLFIDEARYEQSLQELVRYWTSQNVELQTEAWYEHPLLRNMVLNVEVQAPGNLWLTTGPITIEANAYGRIVGEVGAQVFEGRMDILQGEFWYLDHKFIIDQGYLSNKNPYRFNPKYFVSAEIDEPIQNIKLVDIEGDFHNRDIKVYLKFSGYLEEHNPPDFTAEVLYKEFGERYELDRQQIISILTVGGVNTVNSEALMTDTAQAMLSKQAQLYVGNRLAKLIGFRSFQFDLAPYSLEQSRFLVTKELTKRWAITYSSTLQIYEEPYIELEYQLNKHMAVKGERNKEGKYGVDLKLEYEFK